MNTIQWIDNGQLELLDILEADMQTDSSSASAQPWVEMSQDIIITTDKNTGRQEEYDRGLIFTFHGQWDYSDMVAHIEENTGANITPQYASPTPDWFHVDVDYSITARYQLPTNNAFWYTVVSI